MERAGPGAWIQVGADVVVIRIWGESDDDASRTYRQEILPDLRPPLTHVTPDLAGCTCMSAAGVDAVGALYSRATELGAGFAVAHPSVNGRIVLATAGLLDPSDRADPIGGERGSR